MVRLFGRLTLQRRGPRRVESIRLRVQASIPSGAVVRVTDVQLQPGRFVTGWTLHPSDLGVQPVPGWEWRNGVVSGGMTLVVAADVASASPMLWDVRGNADAVQVGQFRFGRVSAGARLDGSSHTATQGAGIPPHLTARSDVDVPVSVAGRVLACCWFRGVTVATNADLLPPQPVHPSGPITTAHAGWWQVLAAHDTWMDARGAHPDWR